MVNIFYLSNIPTCNNYVGFYLLFKFGNSLKVPFDQNENKWTIQTAVYIKPIVSMEKYS